MPSDAKPADRSRRPRIALFASHLFPNFRSPNAGPWLVAQIKALQPQADFTVLVPHPWVPPAAAAVSAKWARYAALPAGEEVAGIRVVHPRRVMLPGVDSWVFRTLAVTLANWHHLSRHHGGFDLLHGHYALPDGFAAVWLGRRYGIPSVVTVHGGDVHTLPSINARVRSVVAWTVGHADCVVAVSEVLAARCRALGTSQERLHVFPVGADTDRFRIMDRQAAKQQLGLEGTIIGCVGSLVPRKQPLVALEAFAELTKVHAGWQLVFVGDGPLRQSVADRAAVLGLTDCVRLVGNVPHELVPVWMNALDVLCVTSKHEGLPTVVVEALACGTPVVTTAVEGVREVLGCPAGVAECAPSWQGKWGAICWESDPAAVALALGEVPGSDRHDRGALRSRAHEFSVGAGAAKLEVLYAGITGKRAAQ